MNPHTLSLNPKRILSQKSYFFQSYVFLKLEKVKCCCFELQPDRPNTETNRTDIFLELRLVNLYLNFLFGYAMLPKLV